MTMVRGLIWWCGVDKDKQEKERDVGFGGGSSQRAEKERSGTYALGLKVPAQALEEELAGSLALLVSLLLDLLNFN